MGKWLDKGKFSKKKEVYEVLESFKKDYKKAGIPQKEIRIKKKGNKYILQQYWD